MATEPDVDDALTQLARNDAGRVVAIVARRFGDLDLAEDAVQDALVEAGERWPTTGVPDNQAAWLHQVARRKAIDRLRRADAAVRRERRARDGRDGDGEAADPMPLLTDRGLDPGDERLRLILLCCHPALDPDTQVALTLRLVGGLTTDEIAAAFLVPTSTLAQRISRAKRKIRDAAIPLSLPDRLEERLGVVLDTLYLIFNEGYLSRGANAPATRVDLCAEAIRLTDVVVGLSDRRPEACGLLALMGFVHARRDARVVDGSLVLLDQQDRTRWHVDEVHRANSLLHEAMTARRPGPFQLQAIIAAHHANAREPDDTDWGRINALYEQLAQMRPSPVVEVNRAVAVTMVNGPTAGLQVLDEIDGLDQYHLFHATRSELLRRAGRVEEAEAARMTAHALATNPAERRLLARRPVR
ncbi:MAG: sigma-70 family RNA polymerase sigma factor [Actinomycetota bacterium]